VPNPEEDKEVNHSSQAFTEEQVSKRWNVSRKTLQAWRLNGGGPVFVKMGKSVRYLDADLTAFEEANKKASTSH
jgi:predicted site-specific integrase-resolvase